MKKIFTIKNKQKLIKLFTSMLLKAIEDKKEDMKKEGYNFNVVDEVKRVKKWITPYTCMNYLQGCVFNIPIATYDAMMIIYNHLGIDKNIDYQYSDSDEETIDREYWSLMGIALHKIIQKLK